MLCISKHTSILPIQNDYLFFFSLSNENPEEGIPDHFRLFKHFLQHRKERLAREIQINITNVC